MYSNNNDYLMYCNSLQERSIIIIIINMQVSHFIIVSVIGRPIATAGVFIAAWDFLKNIGEPV